jgi:hypothetical protein
MRKFAHIRRELGRFLRRQPERLVVADLDPEGAQHLAQRIDVVAVEPGQLLQHPPVARHLRIVGVDADDAPHVAYKDLAAGAFLVAKELDHRLQARVFDQARRLQDGIIERDNSQRENMQRIHVERLLTRLPRRGFFDLCLGFNFVHCRHASRYSSIQ